MPFISPTKTPEYLSAGLPVVSTPVRDVERLYGNLQLVIIGRSADDFVKSIEQQLRDGRSPVGRSQAVQFLSNLSWDQTWAEMEGLITGGLSRKKEPPARPETAPVTVLEHRVSAAHV